MKIKILNYIVSIEKQSNSNSKTPFLENVVVSNENHNTEKTNNSNNNMKNSIDTSNDLKIGRYVQKQMKILSDKNILSIKIINKLQDVSYCKNEFNITFSVLRDKKSGINDEKGYPRYYANDLYFNNFRLTSQWKKEHREFFIKWLNRHNSVKSPINEPKNYDTILPIELNPNNNEVFLETLLKTKSATITTFYKNGTKESKIWNAERMTANSNVIGNLRSRPEFRNGNWQKANIIKVVVEVNNNLSSKLIPEKSNKVNHPKEINMKKDSNSHTLENFKTYLIKQGYSELTPSGNPSTVYDYGKRVENILERERISILKLAENIDFYVSKYDTYGIEAEYGNKSHRAIINALKRFQDFCK